VTVTRALLVSAFLLCALGFSGCKHDRRQAIAASYSSVTKPTPVVAPPLSAIGIASIPVEEEYEVRSAAAITLANLADQVAALEKELR
jgi:hypothetical protein